MRGSKVKKLRKPFLKRMKERKIKDEWVWRPGYQAFNTFKNLWRIVKFEGRNT